MKSFRNILIAEDDNDDYLFLVEALKTINPELTIDKAANGLQVMVHLKSHETPDVIFLDLNMPIRNGLATLQIIKAEEEFSHIPIVIYSSSYYFKAIDEAYKNDADYYIVKPAEIDVLVHYLHTVFDLLATSETKPVKTDFVIGLKTAHEGVPV